MRSPSVSAISVISFSALFLSACAVITESGTEEAVLFAGNGAGEAKPHVALKPHTDLPLSVEFSCPTKIFSAMTSFIIPLPPVVPVGFLNERVSYLRIKLPGDAEHVITRLHLVDQQGATIPLPDSPRSRRVTTDGGAVEITYALKNDCEEFDGGLLEIASFSYKGKYYHASAARLQFDSRIRTVLSYGLA